jgi:hypothetical protein
MIKNKKRFQLLGITLMMGTLLPFFAMAQDPGCGPDCPVDSGLSLLLAAGAGYGIKKYRSSRAKLKGQPYISTKEL